MESEKNSEWKNIVGTIGICKHSITRVVPFVWLIIFGLALDCPKSYDRHTENPRRTIYLRT